MKLVICFAAVVFVITAMQGCAVQKQLMPTGGSRADGTVQLSYEYGAFEIPQVDPQQGLSAARQTCAGWGYADAAPFGGYTKRCTNFSGGACNAWLVTYQYQCTSTAVPSVPEQNGTGEVAPSSVPEQAGTGEAAASEAVNVNSALDTLIGKTPEGTEKKAAKAASNSRSATIEAQELLNKKGYNCGIPDGKMGAKTREAIKSFQRNHQIESTGTLTLETMQKLREP